MFALTKRCSGWVSLYATRSGIALSAMYIISSSTQGQLCLCNHPQKVEKENTVKQAQEVGGDFTNFDINCIRIDIMIP